MVVFGYIVRCTDVLKEKWALPDKCRAGLVVLSPCHIYLPE